MHSKWIKTHTVSFWGNVHFDKVHGGLVWCEPDQHPFFSQHPFHQFAFILLILFFKIILVENI